MNPVASFSIHALQSVKGNLSTLPNLCFSSGYLSNIPPNEFPYVLELEYNKRNAYCTGFKKIDWGCSFYKIPINICKNNLVYLLGADHLDNGMVNSGLEYLFNFK